jgi:hypothetical protein
MLDGDSDRVRSGATGGGSVPRRGGSGVPGPDAPRMRVRCRCAGERSRSSQTSGTPESLCDRSEGTARWCGNVVAVRVGRPDLHPQDTVVTRARVGAADPLISGWSNTPSATRRIAPLGA